jgi:L-lysine 2,3-aminomutase
MLKRYHPLFMSLHFIHPDELTAEVEQACARLATRDSARIADAAARRHQR